jgi:hypothetical protein
MTDQTLSTFYQAATDYGFSRDYQARVSQLSINGQSLPDDRLVYIKSMAIPTKKAAISSVRYFGAEIHSTGVRDYGDSKNWELTFLTDQALYLKRWFEERLEEVASNTDGPGRLNVNPVPTPDSYASIDILDDNLETLLTYKLRGLFVVSVPGITYNLDGTGKVQEFKVTLGYQTWEVLNQTSTDYGVGLGGASSSSGLGSLLGAINSVTKLARSVGTAANAVRYAGRSLRGR